MKFLALVTVWFFPVWLYSQQIAEHNLYHYNLSLINPAATAYLPCTEFIITDRHQWIGMEGAPSVQSLSVQVPKQTQQYRKNGLGMNIVRDANGASQNIGGQFQYAYHITLQTLRLQYLSFGLSGKAGQYIFDESNFSNALYDPAVTFGRQAEWYYNFATGVLLYSNLYFAGVAVYNLFPVNTSLYLGYGNNSYFTTAMGGYTFGSRKHDWRWTSMLYMALDKEIHQTDFTNILLFENGISGGVCLRKYMGDYYRPGQNMLLFLGYGSGKWNFNYTYDLGLNRMQLHHTGSHQLSLRYSLCPDKYACPAY